MGLKEQTLGRAAQAGGAAGAKAERQEMKTRGEEKQAVEFVGACEGHSGKRRLENS